MALPRPDEGLDEVLKQAHLEARPDDAPIVVEGHRSYTEEELIAGLREYAEDLGRVPTFNNYVEAICPSSHSALSSEALQELERGSRGGPKPADRAS